MFIEPFILRALAAAAFLAPACAFLGVFVTARKMSFFSDTIAHGALAGVALGFWLGLTELTIPMVLFSLLVAAALVWLKEHTEVMTDTLMALLLSGSVAAGIIILRLLHGSQAQIHSYLFGDILATGPREVALAAFLFGAVFALLFWKLSQFTLLAANEEVAFVCGVPVRRLDYIFILLLTLSVALSIRLLGIVLVTALVVVPPAAARNIARNLRQQIILSSAGALLAGIAGVVLANYFNLPCGPAIVLVAIALFVLTLIAGKMMNRPHALRSPPPPAVSAAR